MIKRTTLVSGGMPVTSVLDSLLISRVSDIADVSITCRDGTVKAHSLMLARLSPLMSGLLTSVGPGQVNRVIILADWNQQQVELLLATLYTGTCMVPASCYEEYSQLTLCLGMQV